MTRMWILIWKFMNYCILIKKMGRGVKLYVDKTLNF